MRKKTPVQPTPRNPHLSPSRRAIVHRVARALCAAAGLALGAAPTFAQTPPQPTITIVTNTAPFREISIIIFDFFVHNAMNTNDQIFFTLATSGSAANTSDVVLAPSNLSRFVIDRNGPSTQISFLPHSDNLIEGDETFTLTITSILPHNSLADYRIGTPASATVTLPDDNVGIVTLVSNTDPRYRFAEGGSSAIERSAAFTVRIAGGIPVAPVRVPYTLSGIDAADVATQSLTGMVEIPANRTEATLVIAAADDAQNEGTETMTVTLGTPTIPTLTNARVRNGTTQQTARRDLLDDDPITVAIAAPPAATEGASLAFPLRFGGGIPSANVVLDYAIAGAGITPADFVGGTALTGRSATYSPAQITAGSLTLVVPTADDNDGEGEERFTITLGAARSTGPVTVVDATATATLIDNDLVQIAVADAPAVTEGADAVFTVTARGRSTAPITGLTYRLRPGTASAADYDAAGATAMPLRIPAGTDPTVTIRVPTVDDTELETTPETFSLQLEGAVAGAGAGVTLQLATATARATIEDNEVEVSVRGPDGAVTEGDTAAFSLARSGSLASPVTVEYQVEGVDADDFRDPGAGQVIIPAGAATATIELSILEENRGEGDETLRLRLMAARLPPGSAGTAAQGVGTAEVAIAGLEIGVALSGPERVQEGNRAHFQVRLSPALESRALRSEVVVGYALGRVEDSAQHGEDYRGPLGARGTIRIAAGELVGNLHVAVHRDGELEGEEEFSVVLEAERSSSPEGLLRLGTASLRVRIVDGADGEAHRERRTRALLGASHRAATQMATEVIATRWATGPQAGARSGASADRLHRQRAGQIVPRSARAARRSAAKPSEVTQPRYSVPSLSPSRPAYVGGSAASADRLHRLRAEQMGPRSARAARRSAAEPSEATQPRYSVPSLSPSRPAYVGGSAASADRLHRLRAEQMGPRSARAARRSAAEPSEATQPRYSVPSLSPSRPAYVGGSAASADRLHRLRAEQMGPRSARAARRSAAEPSEATQPRYSVPSLSPSRPAYVGGSAASADRLHRLRAEQMGPRSARAARRSAAEPSEATQPRYSVPSLSPSRPAYVGGSAASADRLHRLRAEQMGPRSARAARRSAAEPSEATQPRYSVPSLSPSRPAYVGGSAASADRLHRLRAEQMGPRSARAARRSAAEPSEATQPRYSVPSLSPSRPAYVGGSISEAPQREEPLALRFAQRPGGSHFALRGDDLGWDRLGEDVTLWGAGSFRSLEGDPTLDGRRLDYQGESYGFFVGADQRIAFGEEGDPRQLLAGAALGWTRADLDFRDGAAQGFALSGRFESELLAIHPYLALRPTPHTQLWLLAGYGWGDVEIEEREENDGEETRRGVETDTTLWMVSAGAEGRVPLPAQLGETTQLLVRLAATRSSGSLARTRFDDGALLRGTRARGWRVAGELEGSHGLELPGGAQLRPFVTARLRGDAGDDLGGSWELAVDLGGGADLRWPARGLELGVRGTAQLNAGAGYREHSVAMQLRYDLGGDGRGWTAELESAMAASATAGARGLPLGNGTAAPGALTGDELALAGLGAPGLGVHGGDLRGSLGEHRERRHSFQGELGYGLTVRPALGGAGLMTPYARFALAAESRSYATGLRFESPWGAQLGLEGGLDLGRYENDTNYRFTLRGELPF